MDGKRIKTLVIIILAVVNLFFAGIIVSERAESRGMEARERGELVSVFAQSGIELDPDLIPEPRTVKRCTVARDSAGERSFVAALIGDAEPVEQGGGIVSYENERGWARLRSGGETEAVIYDKSALSASTKAVEYTAELLAGTEFVLSDGVLMARYGDTDVCNCILTATAADEGVRIEGRRLTGAPVEDGTESSVSAYTALIAFLRHISEDGSVVRQICGVGQCCLYQYSASGGTLEPAWRIDTDGGTVYVSAADARILEP